MRFGVPAMVVGGQMLMALALILLAAGPMDSDYARNLLAPMLLVGVGGGIAFPALAILAMSDVAPGDSGLASGLLNTTAQVGGALGLAVLATVSTNRTNELLAASQPLATSLSAGFHLAWGVGAGLIVFSIIVSAIVFLAKSAKDADQVDELEASA
jgi:MFS family permease